MTTGNGNGTRALEEIEFLADLQCRVVDVEAIANAIMPLLELLPMPPAGCSDDDEQMHKGRMATHRLIALMTMLSHRLDDLLRYVDMLAMQRKPRPGSN